MKQSNLFVWGVAGILVVLACFSLLYISETEIPNKLLSSGIVAIISAMIGVVLTVAVTSLLLNKQTEAETMKDKSVKVFEKKQEVYHSFIAEIQRIIKDRKITTPFSDPKNEDDELADLIFQLSYLKMHLSGDNEGVINGITERIGNIVKETRGFDQAKGDPVDIYENMTSELFGIIDLLQNDLYDKNLKTRGKSTQNQYLKGLLENIDFGQNDSGENKLEDETLSIVADSDKKSIQIYFWSELLRQLKQLNPKWEDSGFDDQQIQEDVIKYYSKARKRHRYFGFEFEVYKSTRTGRSVMFSCEIENDYYYGFYWNDTDSGSRVDEALSKISGLLSSRYRANKFWAGWRWPEAAHRLNFWGLKSTGFNSLNDPNKRQAYVTEIAMEMKAAIIGFVKIAQEEQL